MEKGIEGVVRDLAPPLSHAVVIVWRAREKNHGENDAVERKSGV